MSSRGPHVNDRLKTSWGIGGLVSLAVWIVGFALFIAGGRCVGALLVLAGASGVVVIAWAAPVAPMHKWLTALPASTMMLWGAYELWSCARRLF